ncbi:MAG: molybdopterin-guanine dinucleotide biosynthesis protein A [Alphaproteobacteria bacterium]
MTKFGLVWAVLFALLAVPAAAEDRHAGYYYPPPATIETYAARTITLPEATRATRLAFIIGITRKALNRSYPPRFAIFAEGDEAQKMIIVALEDDFLDTLYRARALFAMLTSVALTTPFIVDLGLADFLTFFNLLKLLGFKQVTISDGDGFSHQVLLK